MKFSGIAPDKRPRIPRMYHSKHVLESVRALNIILPKHLETINELKEVVDVVYAGAVTICEIHGKRIGLPSTPALHTEPPWKIRLENKIISMS